MPASDLVGDAFRKHVCVFELPASGTPRVEQFIFEVHLLTHPSPMSSYRGAYQLDLLQQKCVPCFHHLNFLWLRGDFCFVLSSFLR